ncbi:MAG: hypothetical protein HKN22_03185 [Bacteroidia bacterium]|nr:hypothetical protein [Bacteroidia bacterium]
MEARIKVLRARIKAWSWIFIIGLFISGLTGIPLEFELELLNEWIGKGTSFESTWPAMSAWISYCYDSIHEIGEKYPFIYYGTDWLSFGHFVIGISLFGVLRDPIRNIWIVEYCMIACVLVVPFALIFGAYRDIPLFWSLIDCSFGVFGIIPLILVRSHIKELESLL